MTDVHETIEHAGLVVEIVHDDDCENPLTGCDHPGTLCSWTRSFDGDEQIREPDWLFDCDCGEDECGPGCASQREDMSPDEWFREVHSAELAIPVAYGPARYGSRLTVEDDYEDANCVYIFTAKDLDEWGWRPIPDLAWAKENAWDLGRLTAIQTKNDEAIKSATACVTAVVGEVDNWLQGNCWGIIVRKPAGEDGEEGEELDACWGFIADLGDDYLTSTAKEMAEAAAPDPNENPAEVGR